MEDIRRRHRVQAAPTRGDKEPPNRTDPRLLLTLIDQATLDDAGGSAGDDGSHSCE
jgi:hypothetical protein